MSERCAADWAAWGGWGGDGAAAVAAPEARPASAHVALHATPRPPARSRMCRPAPALSGTARGLQDLRDGIIRTPLAPKETFLDGARAALCSCGCRRCLLLHPD